MPKKITLEQVQELASQLSSEDRARLFEFLAKLPDSNLIYSRPPVPGTLVLQSEPAQEILALSTKLGWAILSDGTQVFSWEDREVFRIKFNAPNYIDSCFEQLKDKALHFKATGDGRDLLREKIREWHRDQGTEITEPEVDNVEKFMLNLYRERVLKEAITEVANTIDKNANHVAMAILAKIVQTAGFSVANLLRDTLQIPTKIKASDVESIVYKPEWDRLKTIIGLQSTHGGKRNVKHDWTPEELESLAKNYQELQPIWREAKRIARAAQKSPEASRRNNWRAEVLRAYPDLPTDLLGRFQHLRADDAKPSDIALIHAKIKCGVMETYTARELSDKIRENAEVQEKPSSSSKSTKTRKFKSRT